jgi:excisionase family DNA binding protein
MQEQKATAETWLDTTDIAALMNTSTRTVYRLAESGRIPAYRVGAEWRFDLSEVREALRERSEAYA